MTLHHIAKGCQELLAGLTADLAQEAAAFRTLEAVSRMMIMPRLVLAPLMRGGARHQQKASRIIGERVALFRTRLPQPEIEEPVINRRKKVRQRSGAPESLSETTQRLVTHAVDDRALDKACRLLDNEDLPPVQDAERKLKELHPAGPALVSVDPLCKTGSFDISAD